MVWEHNPASMWMALLTRLGMTPGFPFHLLKRNVPARPRDLALLALGVPLLPVRAGAGGCSGVRPPGRNRRTRSKGVTRLRTWAL